MIAALFFALCALLIVRLNSAFPGMMLYDYSRQIMGKVVAYALAVYFALYFLLVAVHLNIQLTDVLRVEFYPKTPHWAILMVTVLVTGSIAHRGVTNVGRFFELIGAVFVVTAVMTHVVMITQGSLVYRRDRENRACGRERRRRDEADVPDGRRKKSRRGSRCA